MASILVDTIFLAIHKCRRPRCQWEENIRMDLKEIGINTRNLIDSAQDMDYWRDLVNAALKLRVP